MMKPISFFFQIANSYVQEKADLNLKNYFEKAFNFEKPHKFQKLSSETCEFKNVQNSNNSGFFSQGSFEGPLRVLWESFETP